MKTKLAILMTALPLMTAAHGALLFYEGFDYAAGDLAGNGGWSATSVMQVALSGTTTDSYSGTYSSVTTTGGYTYNTASSSGSANVALGSSVTSTFTDGSVTWLSFIDNRGTNGSNAKGALAIGAAALTSVAGWTAPSMVGDGIGVVAHNNNADEAAHWSASTFVPSGVDIPGGTGRDRFNLAKITWSDAGNDTIEWAFFDAGATITETTFNDAGKSTSSASLDQSTFDTLSLGSSFMHYDEIRIASDFDSAVSGTVVVPEPSSALLGGLGMLALLRRRRN